MGDSVLLSSSAERLHVRFEHSHRVTLGTRQFRFAFSSSDRFVNQQLAVSVPLSELRSHGLLGQTHSAPARHGSIAHIEGEVDDYVVVEEKEPLFGCSFPYSRFTSCS